MVTDDEARAVAAHIAAWLRHAFPKHTAKQAAKAFCASQITTQKWLDGSAPPLNRHVMAMIKRWGHPFLRYTYAPLLPDKRTLSEEIAELEQRLAKLKPKIDAEENGPIDPATYFGTQLATHPATPSPN
jgi:hypothetical protein